MPKPTMTCPFCEEFVWVVHKGGDAYGATKPAPQDSWTLSCRCLVHKNQIPPEAFPVNEILQPGDLIRYPHQPAIRFVEMAEYTGFIEDLVGDQKAHCIFIDKQGNAVASGVVSIEDLEIINHKEEPLWIKAKVFYDVGLLWLAQQAQAMTLKASEKKAHIAQAHNITAEALDKIIESLADDMLL